MFIGQWLRSAPKPACISAHRLRARARLGAEAGQTPRPLNSSFSVSTMASVSHTAKPSCNNTGTVRAGLTRATAKRKAEPSLKSKRSLISSKGRPSWRISTHGRIDHDE